MKKLLKLFDDNILRFGVAFTILFTVLYPKLPSIQVTRTWVYIRLEDFVILALALIWVIQFIRKKVSFPKPEGFALIAYWIVGLISLIYCLIFVAPGLIGFFPKIAFLEYGRRIEYMILFFAAFSSVKKIKDLYFYLITLMITVVSIVIYGFGQRFYFLLWHAFPVFFQKYPFCFPAFLTGNEEFAKGVPLCLNDTSRITSTFGGHYDLAAFLVFVIPVLIALAFVVKKIHLKVLLAILGMFALELLNFTSSRTSFGAYVIGVIVMLVVWQKKKWILPILVVSLGVMLLFGNSTIQRFSKTIQQVQVVSADKELPADLKKIISDAKKIEDNKKPEVPPASDFTVGNRPIASNSGYTTVLTNDQLARLENGDIAISSISGGFLIQKAYALDSSFTTRFQAEWPRNWKAFLASPVFGTGYSSLTLATDNDYLRALGESGLTGTIAFLFIFVILGIYVSKSLPVIKDPIIRGYIFGLIGGIVGLLMNAVLIDVFEASKVAEPMWLLVGIGVGSIALAKVPAINYRKEIFHFLSSRIMIAVYLFLLICTAYMWSISNFFVADDFTWLHWAASSSPSDVAKYFISSQNFFYRPLDKTIIYFLYMLFSFQPEGYHIFTLLIHFITAVGVFFLTTKILKNKYLAFLSTLLFTLHPAHTENIYWFSSISINLSTLFITYALLAFYRFRDKKSTFSYVVAILSSLLAFVSYELAVVIPFLLVTCDIFLFPAKKVKKMAMAYIPFVSLLIVYFIIRVISHSYAGGGDYSYNLAKIVPNSIGNFIGYLGLFLGSIPFLGIYTTIRLSLSSHWLILSLILIVLVVPAIVLLYRTKAYKLVWTNSKLKLLVFGLVFAAVSLLIYLPLGNIASRYLYLASIGFSVSFVVLLDLLADNLLQKKLQKTVLVGAIVVLLIGVYFVQNSIEQKKWQDAGKITKQTLTFFRTSYASFEPHTRLYFIDTPVTANGVWVFPVGLSDGLWFIYREHTPQVYLHATFDEANTADLASPDDTYIFRFTGGKIVGIK